MIGANRHHQRIEQDALDTHANLLRLLQDFLSDRHALFRHGGDALSSMHSAITIAPYFRHHRQQRVELGRFPLTELTRARPLATLRLAASASGLGESM